MAINTTMQNIEDFVSRELIGFKEDLLTRINKEFKIRFVQQQQDKISDKDDGDDENMTKEKKGRGRPKKNKEVVSVIEGDEGGFHDKEKSNQKKEPKEKKEKEPKEKKEKKPKEKKEKEPKEKKEKEPKEKKEKEPKEKKEKEPKEKKDTISIIADMLDQIGLNCKEENTEVQQDNNEGELNIEEYDYVEYDGKKCIKTADNLVCTIEGEHIGKWENESIILSSDS